jgi:hypothetical protein
MTKRVSAAGLSVAAASVFACLAVASSASAAEFGQCVSLKHGNYTESGCKTVAEKGGVPDHKGSFEFEPAGTCYATTGGNFTESACKTVAEKEGKPDHKGSFESAPIPTFTISEEGIEWENPGLGSWKCEMSGSGRVTGATTVALQLSFSPNALPCRTAFEAFPLVGTLTEPASGDAQLVLTGGSEHGGLFAEFSDEFGRLRMSGSVGGRLTPTNTSSGTPTLDFESHVEQGLKSEYYEVPATYSSELIGVPSLKLSSAEIIRVN